MRRVGDVRHGGRDPMGGRYSRNKGANFERLVANLLRPVFSESRRGIGQARSAGEVADVEGTPFWVECKRHKKCSVPGAMQQAQAATDGRPCVVVTKDDYGPIRVTIEEMSMEQFLVCLQAIKMTGPSQKT
jgi:hypothetical protein